MSKWVLIGDLHFGERGDSEKFNHQLIKMLEWVCSKFKGKVDGVIQVGDWFHSRSKVKLNTLNHGIDGAKLLGDTFGKDNVFVLKGNHDLMLLDRLDVSSLSAIESYVTVVNDIESLGNMMLVPWIVDGAMWDKVVNESTEYDYCIGHFELNGFKVNDAYTMEHGFSPKGLKKFDHVFSGHYHSFQTKDNITYIGTPIPITQNESNESHGVFVFDSEEGETEFFEYDKVKVVSIPHSELWTLEGLDPENTSVRIEFPDDLEDELLIGEVQEWLEERNFTDTKIKYRGSKAKQLIEGVDEDDVSEVENIDQVVIKYITSASSVKGIDNKILEKYYRKAIETGDVK